MVKRGDMLHIFWSARGMPTKFRWPLLWAIGCGFAIQTIWGIFPVMFCFVLLAGADEARCPLAAPLRPFFGFVAGAVSATLTFKWCLPSRLQQCGHCRYCEHRPITGYVQAWGALLHNSAWT